MGNVSIDISRITIRKGAHSRPPSSVEDPASIHACAMEWVAVLAGEKFSDRPQCACPVIAAFVRRFNDSIKTDARRSELLSPIIPKLVGTRSTLVVERKRAWIAVDWSVRKNTPIFLRLVAGLEKHAAALESLEPLVDRASYERARDVIQEARSAAAAAYAADADAADADAAAAAAYAAAAYAAYAAYAADADAAADAAAAAAADAAYAADAAARAKVRSAIEACQEGAVEIICKMTEVHE